MINLTASLRAAAVILLAAVTALVAATVWTGCGKKAMPQPPSGKRTPRVTDLAYSISDNIIKLSWTTPRTSETARNPVSGFYIYQAKQLTIDAECPNCPLHFELIGDVLVRHGGSGKPDTPLVFTRDIEPGYRYVYKVQAYDEEGNAGRDSNVVDFTF